MKRYAQALVLKDIPSEGLLHGEEVIVHRRMVIKGKILVRSMRLGRSHLVLCVNRSDIQILD